MAGKRDSFFLKDLLSSGTGTWGVLNSFCFGPRDLGFLIPTIPQAGGGNIPIMPCLEGDEWVISPDRASPICSGKG